MHNDPLPQSAIEEGTRAVAIAGCARPAGRAATIRHDAGFVTQLIACVRGLPAYRARRRADPREATSRYAEREARETAPQTARGRCDLSF